MKEGLRANTDANTSKVRQNDVSSQTRAWTKCRETELGNLQGRGSIWIRVDGCLEYQKAEITGGGSSGVPGAGTANSRESSKRQVCPGGCQLLLWLWGRVWNEEGWKARLKKRGGFEMMRWQRALKAIRSSLGVTSFLAILS